MHLKCKSELNDPCFQRNARASAALVGSGKLLPRIPGEDEALALSAERVLLTAGDTCREADTNLNGSDLAQPFDTGDWAISGYDEVRGIAAREALKPERIFAIHIEPLRWEQVIYSIERYVHLALISWAITMSASGLSGAEPGA